MCNVKKEVKLIINPLDVDHPIKASSIEENNRLKEFKLGMNDFFSEEEWNLLKDIEKELLYHIKAGVFRSNLVV